ncbi:hypothetical protein NEPTK9_000896 [Candidatus Neptunochlamydia vexilliferae]|uniref:Uncharacterized protein n=1 Tax=Candidatus Neptunichlamydia vexilliferae TaxID=1651774 RepID=A0ABS0AZ31_9BACT|nr:hypothetical protein [Candidatus Neptunochlamydia vexilliferae]
MFASNGKICEKNRKAIISNFAIGSLGCVRVSYSYSFMVLYLGPKIKKKYNLLLTKDLKNTGL